MPGDWLSRRSSQGRALYFESADETKGLYVTTLRARGAVGDSQELLDKIEAAESEYFASMEGFVWQVVRKQLSEVEGIVTRLTDHLCGNEEYRILWKVLFWSDRVVKATFHDYRCRNYAESLEFFEPLVESLAFNPVDLDHQ